MTHSLRLVIQTVSTDINESLFSDEIVNLNGTSTVDITISPYTRRFFRLRW